MVRQGAEQKDETITFRLDVSLKSGLTEIAKDEEKPVGEVLRELVKERIERRRREAFAAEARRQARSIAARASDPDSDEAVILAELDAALDESDDEWK